MIRIGTRESKLALWQASQVQQTLALHGFISELVLIKSEGDIDLVTPLYEMGVQGVFTRTLDAALLSGKIDLAVHSMKDVPTQLPVGIVQAAVLTRGPVEDVFVFKGAARDYNNQEQSLTIATSSIRRKAQWLHRFPNTEFHNLRGNMQTRLSKLESSSWDGAVFAKAGLERIDLLPSNHLVLDWMLPAPAQGAVMIVCREEDAKCITACALINDEATAICTKVERDFLRGLMGGCSTPISAIATYANEQIHFKGNVCSKDGKEMVDIVRVFEKSALAEAGFLAATQLIENGGRAIVEKLNNE